MGRDALLVAVHVSFSTVPVTAPPMINQGVVAASAGTTASFASVNFKGTITLGSIIVALLVAAVAGVFTIRAKIASTWKDEAEAERARAERLTLELAEEKADRSAFEREQQELRHALKDEKATLLAQLKVEEAKHDLSALLERMQAFHSEAMTSMRMSTGAAVDAVAVAIDGLGSKLDTHQISILAGQDEQKKILIEIRDALGSS